MTSALNLSLLARGVGEVKRNGSEKIDVVLEPSDYHNFTETHLYLPPIRNQQVNSRNAYYENKKLSLPKTFVTRKGALLLFSEDFAQKSKYRRHGDNGNKDRVASAFEALDLHTVEDLTKSILSYGGPSGKGEVNLHFVKEGPIQRRVRPGFSARRYLSKLTRSFDETFLSNLMNKGYVSEKSIFQTNILLPNLKKRINDDLSHMPTPYRIMHQMLLAPGILSGYSFYRKTTDRADSDLTTLDEEGHDLQGRDKGELKIVEINDGEIKSIDYSNLPEEQKKNVLADLLVKSAISHALEKQKQMLQSRSQSAQDSDDDGDDDDDDNDRQLMISGRASFRSDQRDIQEFDMADAVRSYIESQLSSHIDAEITEVIRTQRKPKPTQRKQIEVDKDQDARPTGKRRPPRGPSKKAEHISTTPVLPPIGDRSALVESETRDVAVSARAAGDVHVPVFTVEPPTPQNTSLSDRQRRAKKVQASKQITEDIEDDEDYDDEVAEVVPKRRRNKRVEHLKASKDVGAITQKNVLSPTSSVASKGHHLSPGSMLESGSESTRSDYTTDSPILPPPMPKFRGKALRATGGAPKVRAPEVISKAKGSVVVLPGGDVVKVGGTVHGPGGDFTPQTSRTEEYSTTDYDTERDDWTSKHAQTAKTYHEEQGSEFTESEYTTEEASSPELKKLEAVQEVDKQVKSSKPASEVSKKECQESEADMHETMTAWSYENAVRSHLTEADNASDTVELSNLAEDSRRESYQSGSTPPEISEEELVQHLSDQAHRIASAILSRPETGFSLTEDAQRVGELKSGRMSVAEEYKTLLKDTINSALIKSQGDDAVLVPEDADIDEEVMRAIARNDKLGPDDLEIVENEHGQQIVRIKKSHKTATKRERERRKVQSDSGSTEETQHYDSSQYSGSLSRSGKSEGKAPSERLRSRSRPTAEADQEGVVPPESDSSKTEATSDFVSGSRTSDSQKREQTRSRSKSGATKEDTKEEFVVRTVHDNSELQRLYGPVDTPPPRTRESKKPRVPPAKPQKKAKKKKAAEKKKIEMKSSESEKDSSPTRKEVPKVKPVKPASETATSQDISESESVTSEEEEKKEEMEFVIVRDEFSDSETDETQKAQSVTSSKAKSFKSTVLPSMDGLSDTDSAHKHAEPSPTPDTSLHTVSSKEARAAERAARANKKREEVERRRREREEQLKREKEMLDERERLQRELEEERRRKEEERRMQREREEAERRRQEQEEQDRERRRRLEAERERRMREEYARKLEQLKKQKMEEDRKRRELAEQRQREEEERRRQEEELLASMSENERIEYLKKKAEEEERRRIELEERKRREAEEMAALEAEARRLADEMALKQAEMEQRLQFNRSLHLEAHGLEHTLNITEAFTWSYFELLQWLGLDLPDFERMKNNRF